MEEKNVAESESARSDVVITWNVSLSNTIHISVKYLAIHLFHVIFRSNSPQ